MDNFDLKKYLQHNPLLEQKSEKVDEETINELKNLGYLQCIRCGKEGKKEKAYRVRGKYVYCNSEPKEECPNALGVHIKKIHEEFIFLNESINENNPEYVIDTDEVLRLINVYKNQYDPVIDEIKGKSFNLCVLTIAAITNIIATFPKFFADLGPEGIRIFVYSLFQGKKDSMIPFFDYVQRNEPTDDKIWNLRTHPLIRTVKGTASASMGLLSAMIAVALKLIEKTAKIGCLSVLGLDAAGSMAKLAIRTIESGDRDAGVDHSDKDGIGYIKFMKKMRKGK